MSNDQRIIPINIEDEMKSAYIDYSMSVIVARALPDVRDGLKPVHRRILFGMEGLGLAPNKAHKKSARIVGEVLGKYHPHGDSSVYDAMVRMAQDWSMRYPLVDGQGNFGSMDGDSPAAMRYTEARLAPMADYILEDIKKETVDFELNFDDSLEEPTILPTRIPNLLVNGASGIAVGMATNMLPHNLGEVIDGLMAYLDNTDISIDDLMDNYIKAPDFPTGGTIYGLSGVRDAYHTGRGRVVVRAKTEIESDARGKETIIVNEIPFQVNKSTLVAKIAELVNEEKVTGISAVRDESDRSGLRIVIEVKRDAMANVVLSKLFKYTPLQSSYGVNNIALVKGRPMTLNLKDMLRHFIDFRIDVIIRRAKYELRKAEERAHILEGLLIALDHLDEIIALIRASQTPEIAKQGLMAQFKLSEVQAKAILDMRLQKLTGLERQKLKDEYEALQKRIAHYKALIASEDMQKDVVREELTEVRDSFADTRRTDITYADGEISIEDLIPNDRSIVTISQLGYIKRTKSQEYKVQARGGRGARGSKTRDEDFIEHMFVANNHNWLLLFTEQGRCHWLRVFEVPEASKTSTGRVIQNIINLPKDDKVKAYIIVENLNDEAYLNNHFIVFCTKKGVIKKTILEAYSRPRANGINAITIREGDQLIEARLTTGQSQIIMANTKGLATRFEEAKVGAKGRTSMGVTGMKMGDAKDYVVGMACVEPDDKETTLLVISEKGLGKRSPVDEYRLTNRATKGVKTIKISDKTGALLTLKAVKEIDDLIITTRHGLMIRMSVADISELGRATQGVRVINIKDDDAIADVALIRGGGLDRDEEE